MLVKRPIEAALSTILAIPIAFSHQSMSMVTFEMAFLVRVDLPFWRSKISRALLNFILSCFETTAKRDIAAGEFLSYDYHFDTRQGDRFICRCGAKNCRGTMKGGVTGAEAEKSKKEQWEDAKKEYEKDKEFLAEFNAKEEARRSLVDAMVPHSENADELVANGAPYRHCVEAQQGRIFLWRNTQLGSDFATRLMRIGKKSESKCSTK
jgi:hypothetical protein